ncbi:MAG: DUF3048 domain-containing protein [Candidatus Beckwithbacteria bacterium]|nr:DUF3048 domain-containing protein [Candidatus Beckwithbacteria bacterium]
MPNKKFLFIIGSVGVYLLVTGISFAAFTFAFKGGSSLTSPLSSSNTNQAENNNRKALTDVTGAKTAVCPLNGAKYSAAEQKLWESRRPLAVMIENHLEARPQSGLSDADIVYEGIAEGGITRFEAIFYCQAAAYESIIGPVRSARTYFVDWASEYNLPLYAHVGGANTSGPADALGQLESYGWAGANDLNQFSIGYPTFWRDYERLGHTVATEHTMYSTTTKLWEIGVKRGFTNLDPDKVEWSKGFTPWKFAKDDSAQDKRSDSQTVSYPFWEDENYAVSWQYDKTSNLYKRFNGGQEHKDLNINEQLTTKNLLVQFSVEKNANDGYPGNVHLLYTTIGQGKALIFKDGQAIAGTWAKAKRTSRTVFYDDKAKEIVFNPGKIWISVLPVGTKVAY